MQSIDKHIEMLRAEARRVLSSFFESHTTDYSDVLTPNTEVVFDGFKCWDSEKLAAATVHDEDYVVFSHFRDKSSLILDIGAHYGYSAASMWAAGCQASILSFEPIPAYSDTLESLHRLTSGRASFLPIGLGRESGLKQHVTPVINGIAVGALSTMNPQPDLQSLEDNVIDYFVRHIKTGVFEGFRLVLSEVTVRSLNEIAADPVGLLAKNIIPAIKIDVEGYENEVLLGGSCFLVQQKPLILAENGHQNPAIAQTLAPLGYRPAKRLGNWLVPSMLQQNLLNGFFYHQSNQRTYEERGLLRPSC